MRAKLADGVPLPPPLLQDDDEGGERVLQGGPERRSGADSF